MLPIAIDTCFSKIHKTKELPPNVHSTFNCNFTRPFISKEILYEMIYLFFASPRILRNVRNKHIFLQINNALDVRRFQFSHIYRFTYRQECVAIADAPIRIRTSRGASNNIEKKIWYTYEIESAHLKSTAIALLKARRILEMLRTSPVKHISVYIQIRKIE